MLKGERNPNFGPPEYFENKMNDKIQKSADELSLAITESPYVNNLDLLALREMCFESKPFRHICIDGMWDEEFLSKVSNEVLDFDDWAGEKDFYGSKKKRWQADWDLLPPNTNSFLAYLNQPTVLKIIEFLTGEEGLIADPYLEGGGIHSTGEGGFLKLHTDFNWNKKLKLYRRINILVYLNKDWHLDFGGQIELAGKGASGEFNTAVSLEPIFNRTVIFVTDDSSLHGQPNPVSHPHNKRRNSIAAYYYLSEKPSGTSAVKRTGTDYINENGKRIRGIFLKRALNKIKRTLSINS